jgi:hypothetical protein
MISVDNLLQIIVTVIGSNALFAFITFLIKRKDDKDDRFKQIEQKLDDGLEERENTGKERYEEHREAIEELRQAILALTEDARERSQLEKCMASSLMALSHDKLVTLGKIYQRRGAITLAEQNNLKLIYTPYHNGLGGNSDGEGYYEYCMHLPVVTEEEAIAMDNANKIEQFRLLNGDK